MGLFSIFPSKAATSFAEELAQGMTKDLPPKLMLNSANIVSANRVTTILERVYSKAAGFQGEHRLGFFRRASFGNAFRWKLKDLGYPDEFVSIATEGLLVALSRTAKTKTN